MTTSQDSVGLASIPFRLGFFLVRPNVCLVDRPNAPYRGIDRVVYTPAMVLGRDLSSRELEIELRFDEYMVARDSGLLQSDLSIAYQQMNRLQEVGMKCEVVYCEIAKIPDNINLLKFGASLEVNLTNALRFRQGFHERISGVPEGWKKLGFDVSHPVPSFHSAIYQPGLGRLVPNLYERLNENGLVETLDLSVPLLEKANEMGHGGFPFCILSIQAQQ
jgi:hypothetical protein